MKGNKTISLSDEILKRLKEEKNASGLIDDLLKTYFYKDKPVLDEKDARIESERVINEGMKEAEKIRLLQAERDAYNKRQMEWRALSQEEKDAFILKKFGPMSHTYRGEEK